MADSIGTMPEPIWRDDLALVMIAAWCGTTPDNLPPEMRAHTCPATAAAWGRVADAARAHLAVASVAHARSAETERLERAQPFCRSCGRHVRLTAFAEREDFACAECEGDDWYIDNRAPTGEVQRPRESDDALVDRYRDPKTGSFSFPSDVAAIIRRLEGEWDSAREEALATFAEPLAVLPRGPWETWTSNSYRRITGPDGKDGGVLHALNHRSDGHPDLSWSAAQCEAICAIVNGLRALTAPPAEKG